MSTQANVFAVYADATGASYAGPMNLCGYHIKPGGTAGSLVLRDGGAGGAVRLTVDLTNSTDVVTLQIPGNGIRFTTNFHVTLPAGTTITMYLG